MADTLEKQDTNVNINSKDGSNRSTEDGSELAYENIFGSDVPPRHLKTLDIISAGFNICNSWSAVAATLFLGFISGGPVTIVWGMVVATFAVGCAALSLAELAAKYPTAGGQYHWAYILAPTSIRRVASYVTAVVNIFAWLALTASICVIIPQIVLGLAVYWNPTFQPERYQGFLIYQVSNLLFVAYNISILRRAAWTLTVGLVFSLLCWFTFWIACLAKASPNYASSSYVWSTLDDAGTGWSTGIMFMITLPNANFMFAGIDGAVHLAEDALNAATAVPWALISTITIGFITTFPFTVSLFYCITDPVAILESPVPIFGIFLQATGSDKGATAMTVFLLMTGFWALMATIQTASRLTWSFARDHGIVFSKQIGHVQRSLGVPVWAILANAVVVFIMGCIYLGSTIAFNAVVGTSLILMHIGIAIPVLFLMLKGRSREYLPSKGHFYWGAAGWLFNFVTVAWAFIILIFYCFPPTNPTSGGTMNYASAVLGVMLLFGIINWFIYARKRYTEPRIDLVKLARLEDRGL